MPPKIIAFGVILFSATLWLAGGYILQESQHHDAAMLNYPLPSELLPVLSLDNKEYLNPTESITRPFLLNVWASWCVSCRSENIHLKHLQMQGVRIVGLNLRDDPRSALSWLSQYGSPYAVIFSDAEGAYAEKLGVTGAPETFLIDQQGAVRFHYQGLIDKRVWDQRLLPLYSAVAIPKP